MKKLLFIGYLFLNISVAVSQKANDSLVLVKCIIKDIKPTDDTLIFKASAEILRISGGFKPLKNELIFDTDSYIWTRKERLSRLNSFIRKDTFLIYCFFKNEELINYFDIGHYRNTISVGFPATNPFFGSIPTNESYKHREEDLFDAYDAYYLPDFKDRVESLKKFNEKENFGLYLILMENLLNGYRGVTLRNSKSEIAESIIYYPQDEFIRKQIYRDWLRNDTLSNRFKSSVYKLLYGHVFHYNYSDDYSDMTNYWKDMLIDAKNSRTLSVEQKEYQIEEAKRGLHSVLVELESNKRFYNDKIEHFKKEIDYIHKILEE